MRFALVLSYVLWFGADGRPDFTGSWVLDRDRSFSNPPGLNQTMTVAHQGDRVRIDATLVTAQGEQVVKEEWILDGIERDFTLPGPPNARGKRRAYWLPMNRGIVVEDSVTVESAKGTVLQQTTRKWTLSADAARLTADYYFDRPTGSGESRRVFTRAGGGGPTPPRR